MWTPSTGRPSGAPIKITSGDDFVNLPSVTTDGRNSLSAGSKRNLTCMLPNFLPRTAHIDAPTTYLDDADDLPFDWTVDDKSVLFISNRTGGNNIFDIFTQRIDENSAEMVVSGPEQKAACAAEFRWFADPLLAPPDSRDIGGQRGLRFKRARKRAPDASADPGRTIASSAGRPRHH